MSTWNLPGVAEMVQLYTDNRQAFRILQVWKPLESATAWQVSFELYPT